MTTVFVLLSIIGAAVYLGYGMGERSDKSKLLRILGRHVPPEVIQELHAANLTVFELKSIDSWGVLAREISTVCVELRKGDSGLQLVDYFLGMAEGVRRHSEVADVDFENPVFPPEKRRFVKDKLIEVLYSIEVKFPHEIDRARETITEDFM